MKKTDEVLSTLFGDPPGFSLGEAWEVSSAGDDEVVCVCGLDVARFRRHGDAHCLSPPMSDDQLFEHLSGRFTFTPGDERAAAVMGAATQGIGSGLMLVLFKRPQRSSGLTYCGLILLPAAAGVASVEIRCLEAGITGIREAWLFDQRLRDPSLPPADHVAWDKHFPGHPLTRLHEHMQSLMTSSRPSTHPRPDAAAKWCDVLHARMTADEPLETPPAPEDPPLEYLIEFSKRLPRA